MGKRPRRGGETSLTGKRPDGEMTNGKMSTDGETSRRVGKRPDGELAWRGNDLIPSDFMMDLGLLMEYLFHEGLAVPRTSSPNLINSIGWHQVMLKSHWIWSEGNRLTGTSNIMIILSGKGYMTFFKGNQNILASFVLDVTTFDIHMTILHQCQHKLQSRIAFSTWDKTFGRTSPHSWKPFIWKVH